MKPPISLCPPQRLGVLLRQTRVDAGLDLAELSARSELLTMVDLDDLEHGRRTLDDDTLRHLVDLYVIRPGSRGDSFHWIPTMGWSACWAA